MVWRGGSVARSNEGFGSNLMTLWETGSYGSGTGSRLLIHDFCFNSIIEDFLYWQ